MAYRWIVGTLWVLGWVSAASAQLAPGGREFELSADQDPSPGVPALAMVDGRAAAVWHGDCVPDVGCDVVARLVGKPTGPAAVRLNDGLALWSASERTKPSVVGSPDGHFVAFWRSPERAINGRHFDPVTGPIGDELAVAAGTATRSDPVAMAIAGGLVVAWAEPDGIFFQRFTFDALPVGDLVRYDVGTIGLTLALAPLPDGGFAVAFVPEPTDGLWGISLQRFDVLGEPIGGALEVTPLSGVFKTDPALAIGADGRGVVAWREMATVGVQSGFRGRRVLRSGLPAGPTWDLSQGFVGGATSVIVLPDDRFALAYAYQIALTQPPEAVMATFDGTGTAVGNLQFLGLPRAGDWDAGPVLASDGRGNGVAAWLLRTDTGADPHVVARGVGPERLTVGVDDRFQVSVRWQDFRGGTGSGIAMPVSQDTGSFWFFDPANVELNVKVLDGRGANGHFWVFYGSLSNVAFTLTVTDTVTGAVRVYDNPLGTFASRGDTLAFPESP